MNALTFLNMVRHIVIEFNPSIIRNSADWWAVSQMASSGLRLLHGIENDESLRTDLRAQAHDLSLSLGTIQQRSSDEYESSKA
jgi:hypothetical protein